MSMALTKAIHCTAAEAAHGGKYGDLLDGETHVVRRQGGKAIYHLAFLVQPWHRHVRERVRFVRLAPGPFPPATNHRIEFYAEATDQVVISENAGRPKRPRAFYLT